MQSRFLSIIMLCLAIVAFLPVLAVDRVLDGYVRAQESGRLQTALDGLVHDSELAIQGGVAALRDIISRSPSLCTTTFYQNVATALQRNLFLRQVIVENGNSVQYCTAFDGEAAYTVRSPSLTLPGSTETITAAVLTGVPEPVFRISQTFSGDRIVSVFVSAVPLLARGPVPPFDDLSYLRVSLTNGTAIASQGLSEARLAALGDDLISVRSVASAVPLRAEAGIRFSAARASYAGLDIAFTLMACLIAIMQLLATLSYTRRAKLPAFDLERAIGDGELKPFYQPVFSLRTGRMVGCEVLIRWIKRNGQVIPPGAFIDYAEMTGLAIPMTLSLMDQVRHDLEALCRDTPTFKVSINLFEGHFRDGAVVDDIQSIFGGSGIRFRQLVFEITERRPLDDRDGVNRTIAAMHALGVRVAMDDAGTGHSNLAYLQTLGIDIVKIDKIFVDMIKQANAPVPVVDGLIAMARDMDLEIVAEGVETQEQALYLRSRGVDSAQGYLFSPPVKVTAFLKLARALKPLPQRTLPVQDRAA